MEHCDICGPEEYADITQNGLLQRERKVSGIRKGRSEPCDAVLVRILLTNYKLREYAVYKEHDKGSKEGESKLDYQFLLELPLK